MLFNRLNCTPEKWAIGLSISIKDYLIVDIEQINQQLRNASANEIVAWALSQGKKTIATTSFGKNAAVMLNVISQVDESVPTIWVDTGYNLRDTYVVAEKLIKRIPLDYHVYSPLMLSLIHI